MAGIMLETTPLFFGRTVSSGATIEQLLDACRSLLRDETFPTVRLWREMGGKVLGHFQVYFPAEIAHAAGILPLKLGCSGGVADREDAHFGSYICSIIKDSFFHAGAGMELDMFVAPSICDAVRNLAVVWSRNFDYPCRTLYLPQNSASLEAANYLLGEYSSLAASMAQLTGHAPDDASLRRSMVVYNCNRALLRQLNALKSAEPWKVSIADCYLLTAIGSLLPPEEHNQLLETALTLLDQRKAPIRDKIRVVLNGCFCEQPPTEMLDVISRSCHVVADDLLIGLRWITGDIDPHPDPLASLARAYLEQSLYSPVQHDGGKPGPELLVESARRHDAHAVIITAAKMCEPGLEDLVPLTAALGKANIPCCVCEFEHTMASFDMLELQLETFAENIMYAHHEGDEKK